MFGHPAPSTIEVLQRFGARVYRTDENGASTIMTDGESVQIDPMLQLKGYYASGQLRHRIHASCGFIKSLF